MLSKDKTFFYFSFVRRVWVDWPVLWEVISMFYLSNGQIISTSCIHLFHKEIYKYILTLKDGANRFTSVPCKIFSFFLTSLNASHIVIYFIFIIYLTWYSFISLENSVLSYLLTVTTSESLVPIIILCFILYTYIILITVTSHQQK